MNASCNKNKSSLKAALKWSPAVPIRKTDNIISSKAREKNLLGFKPTYEVKNEPIDMKCLMNNEYMRSWFKQRAVFEKDTYTREEIIKQESKIHRKFVQRMMTYRHVGKCEKIERKIRESKLNEEELKELEYQKLKYKPECSRVKKPVYKRNEVKRDICAPFYPLKNDYTRQFA